METFEQHTIAVSESVAFLIDSVLVEENAEKTQRSLNKGTESSPNLQPHDEGSIIGNLPPDPRGQKLPEESRTQKIAGVIDVTQGLQSDTTIVSFEEKRTKKKGFLPPLRSSTSGEIIKNAKSWLFPKVGIDQDFQPVPKKSRRSSSTRNSSSELLMDLTEGDGGNSERIRDVGKTGSKSRKKVSSLVTKTEPCVVNIRDETPEKKKGSANKIQPSVCGLDSRLSLEPLEQEKLLPNLAVAISAPEVVQPCFPESAMQITEVPETPMASFSQKTVFNLNSPVGNVVSVTEKTTKAGNSHNDLLTTEIQKVPETEEELPEETDWPAPLSSEDEADDVSATNYSPISNISGLSAAVEASVFKIGGGIEPAKEKPSTFMNLAVIPSVRGVEMPKRNKNAEPHSLSYETIYQNQEDDFFDEELLAALEQTEVLQKKSETTEAEAKGVQSHEENKMQSQEPQGNVECQAGAEGTEEDQMGQLVDTIQSELNAISDVLSGVQKDMSRILLELSAIDD